MCSSSSTTISCSRRCEARKRTCLAARAALEGTEAQLRKNVVEAEGPDVEFARKAFERAQGLFAQHLISQSALDDSHRAVEVAENRKRAAQSQLAISQAKVAEARAQVAQAKAAADRAAEDLANATIRAPIRATVLTRDEVGSPVSSILNLGANAGRRIFLRVEACRTG